MEFTGILLYSENECAPYRRCWYFVNNTFSKSIGRKCWHIGSFIISSMSDPTKQIQFPWIWGPLISLYELLRYPCNLRSTRLQKSNLENLRYAYAHWTEANPYETEIFTHWCNYCAGADRTDLQLLLDDDFVPFHNGAVDIVAIVAEKIGGLSKVDALRHNPCLLAAFVNMRLAVLLLLMIIQNTFLYRYSSAE